jgi:hypothetical protein
MSGECDIRATVGDNRAKLAGQDRDFSRNERPYNYLTDLTARRQTSDFIR